MPYTEAEQTWKKLSLITERARRDSEFKFSSLAHHLNKEFLRDCYKSLNREKAVGIDNVSWEEYGRDLEGNLERLVEKLKRKSYKPIAARRVYIPKNKTEERPLGIPALENKIVERGITHILESIYEQDFMDSSYGFRPKRNSHQALKRVHDLYMNHPANHIVEADIKGFFDNVEHDKLMEFIRIRIVDTTLLELIEKFLKAGYVDNGMLVRTEKGTPQGSILSPMLANIFLHYVLDTWYENKAKPNIKGFCELVRYADDFVCVVQHANEARRIERGLKNRFEKYGLEIHPTKSRNISFGRYERQNSRQQNRRANTFEFLGFTHYCAVSRSGKFKIGRKTSRKKFIAKCKAMNNWLKEIRNREKTEVWWKTLATKLRGHYQYYGVSENSAGIAKFYRKTIRLVFKWLNRRSQRKGMSWERFKKYLNHYPLPKPRIVHSFYAWSHVK
jgi:RNA-directed DNA polymerase